MKKVLALLFALLMLLNITACSNGETEKSGKDREDKETVTLYLIKTMEIKVENGPENFPGVVEFVYEEGWQEKDSFTIRADLTVNDLTQTLLQTASDKKLVQQTIVDGDEMQKTETVYDENGRAIKQTIYLKAGMTDKVESTRTYDKKGRLVKEVSKTYFSDGTAPIEVTQTFTFQETAEGSKAVNDTGMVTQLYNEKNQLIEQTTLINGEESSRIVYTYNEYGKQQTVTTYIQGALSHSMTYTYTPVEVSKEKAEQLPWFQ